MLTVRLNQKTALMSSWRRSFLLMSATFSPLSCRAMATKENTWSMPTMP